MGHFFGNVGLFYSEVCGRYYSLVTNEQDIVLIYRHIKNPIAVSVADPTIFSVITSVEKKWDYLQIRYRVISRQRDFFTEQKKTRDTTK